MNHFVLFGLAALAVAAPQKRATGTTDTMLFAYGTGINGLPIQSTKDGSIVLSESHNSSLYNITIMPGDSTTTWNATLDRNTTTLDGFRLYIVPTENSVEPIGLVSSNATDVPDGAVTTGLILFGSTVQYNTGSTYISQFWARPADSNATEKQFEILWNSAGESLDDSVPVVLKTIGPVVLDKN